MKRLHVHVGVADLDRSIQFYSTLFGADPTVQKPDYAKWMLEDPRVNFAIYTDGEATSYGDSPELGTLGANLADDKCCIPAAVKAA